MSGPLPPTQAAQRYVGAIMDAGRVAATVVTVMDDDGAIIGSWLVENGVVAARAP